MSVDVDPQSGSTDGEVGPEPSSQAATGDYSALEAALNSVAVPRRRLLSGGTAPLLGSRPQPADPSTSTQSPPQASPPPPPEPAPSTHHRPAAPAPGQGRPAHRQDSEQVMAQTL